MNKLFKTLAASVLGLALAAGVGVGVAGGVKTNDVNAGVSTYSCGFEEYEGFTAGSTYNNEQPRLDGPEGQQWGSVFGTVSTTKAITGSNSMQLRYYYNKSNLGYFETKFALPGVQSVTYKALANSSKSGKISLDTYYSTDNSNWTKVDDGKTIAASAAQYSFDVNGSSDNNYYIKFAVSSKSSKPTDGNVYLIVDEISIQYETSGDTPLDSISVQDINTLPGQVAKAMVTYNPSSASNKNVSYAITSGSDVASVADDGTITALKSGVATLTVTPEDTRASATTATITVGSYPTVEVVQVGKKYAIVSGNQYELIGIESSTGASSEYSGSPMYTHVYEVFDGLYDNTVAFKNGDKYLEYHGTDNKLYEDSALTAKSSWTVATEDDRLVVRNVAERSRVLTCNTSTHKFNCYANLNQSAVDFVEYVEGIPLESFSFAATMDVKNGLSKAIEVTYVPSNASDKTLEWVSSDETVATVSGGVVTAVSEGTAVITASKAGLESQSCTVTVGPLTQHAGTSVDPYTVEDAVSVANAGLTPSSVYIKGIVTKFISDASASKCSFWVGDNSSQQSAAEGGFEFFKLAGVTEEAFKLIKVGSTVVGCGNIIFYNHTTPELAEGGSLEYNSYANANAFGVTFNSGIASICAESQKDAPGTASSTLVSFFSDQATAYSSLSEVEKEHFAIASKTGSSATDLEKMLATYDYCISKYTNLNNFLGRAATAGSSIGIIGSLSGNSNVTIAAIIAISVTSISLLGATLFIKKRKTTH